MNTANKNLFFFSEKKLAVDKFTSVSGGAEVTENILKNHKKENYINGYYVEKLSSEKSLSEIHGITPILKK